MTDPHPEYPATERTRLALRWLPARVGALLDAGCSWGYGTRFFAERADRTAGVELDQASIDVARSRYPNVEFAVAALDAIPHPDAAFDAVVCLDVLEHVPEERPALDELHRVLAPGGLMILTTPHRGAFSFLDPVNVLRRLGRIDEPHHRHYTLDDLRALLDASAWKGRYAIERVRRSGLLVYPLALWVAASPRVPRPVQRLASLALELDYLVPFGPASYSVAIAVRKAGS